MLLIFDVYGTLISTGTGSIDASKRILSLQDNKAILPEVFYKDWKKYHRLHMDDANKNVFVKEEEIFRLDLAKLYTQYKIHRDANMDAEIMLDTLGKRNCFPETVSVINRLREHHRVVIGSTTDNKPLLADMERNGLTVDAVYTSETIGKYKPQKAFYTYILEQEKCDAKEAVFVGDSYLDDICGPDSVGMKTILVDRKHSFGNQQYLKEEKTIKPWRIVDSLAGIKNVLEKAKRSL